MPNELSEKVYPDGTVVKLRDDTAREQIAGINSDLVLERFTPTLVSALGTPNTFDSNCFYNPKTKQVHLGIFLYSASSLIPTANNIIFTVADKYRPSLTTQLGAAMVISEANWSERKPLFERCYISIDGHFCLNNFMYGSRPTNLLYVETSYISK